MFATLVNGALIIFYETISNVIRCHNYFSMYVGSCICSYMLLLELMDSHKQIYCGLPHIVLSPTMVHNVGFFGKQYGIHIVRVNSICKFAS